MNLELRICAALLCLCAAGCDPPSNPTAASATPEPKPPSSQDKPTSSAVNKVAPPGQDKVPSAAALKPLIVSPTDGEVWNLFGDQIIRKVAGKDTNGSYAVILNVIAPGGGPPPHIHHSEEELFMVEEGEFELRFGDETKKAGPGTIAMLPRDVPHGFRNIGRTQGKVYTVITPARFEGFFEEVLKLPEKERGDIAKVSAIGKKYNLEFLPPPPGAAPPGAAPSGTAAAGAPPTKK